MKNLSLKLDDAVFLETEKMVEQLNETRNRYINKAVDFFNKMQKKKMIGEQIAMDSLAVREGSLEICRDLEPLDPHLLDG